MQDEWRGFKQPKEHIYIYIYIIKPIKPAKSNLPKSGQEHMDLQRAALEADRNCCSWKLAHLARGQLHPLSLAAHHDGPDRSIHRLPNCRNQDPSQLWIKGGFGTLLERHSAPVLFDHLIHHTSTDTIVVETTLQDLLHECEEPRRTFRTSRTTCGTYFSFILFPLQHL